MSFNTRKYKEASELGFQIGQEVTPSVMAVARLRGIKPKALAEALADEEANSLYRADVSQALQRVAVKQAVADTADNAVKSLKKVLGIGKGE